MRVGLEPFRPAAPSEVSCQSSLTIGSQLLNGRDPFIKRVYDQLREDFAPFRSQEDLAQKMSCDFITACDVHTHIISGFSQERTDRIAFDRLSVLSAIRLSLVLAHAQLMEDSYGARRIREHIAARTAQFDLDDFAELPFAQALFSLNPEAIDIWSRQSTAARCSIYRWVCHLDAEIYATVATRKGYEQCA